MRKKLIASIALLALSACAGVPTPSGEAKLETRQVAFSDLPGWHNDRMAGVADAFSRSCDKISKRNSSDEIAASGLGGKVREWQYACSSFATLSNPTPGSLRKFFETEFTPYLVMGDTSDSTLFTGYYEIDVPASWKRNGAYQYPIYRAPKGTLAKSSRKAIDNGALRGKNLEIAYTSDPARLFFLHIQGSGRLIFPDGTIRRIGYDGQNGQEYVAIGKELIDRGEISREDMSAPAIIEWLHSHPAEATALMQTNPSYVYLKLRDGEGPIGAQGVPLTPERSIALDKRLFPMGAPIWVDVSTPQTSRYASAPFNRMLIAQDTGGAIRGPLRADIFWGYGDSAEELAGHMKNRGRMFILIPKSSRMNVAMANDLR